MNSRRLVQDYLRSLPAEVSEKGTEGVLNLAQQASDFVQSPYWGRVCLVLSATISAETEDLLNPTLSKDRHDLSRASVAICRKVLAMPHRDIETGRLAMKAVEMANWKSRTNRPTA